MVRYEALVLTVPEITQDEIKNMETMFDATLNKAKASLVSFERWGKYRLAYEVNKNDYGVYFLVRFESEATGIVDPVKSLLAIKLNNLVMRSMVSRLDVFGAQYHRPQSLEETPAREMGPLGRERGQGFGADRRGGDFKGRSPYRGNNTFTEGETDQADVLNDVEDSSFSGE